VAAYRKPIELRPSHAQAFANLGNAQRSLDDLPGAVAAYRTAVTCQPDLALAHYNLGLALTVLEDHAGAAAAYRGAIAVKSDFAEAHCKLGQCLARQGELRTAVEALRRGHDLGSRNPGWQEPSARWLRATERMLELDGRLGVMLGGKATPAGLAERLDLPQLCSCKSLNRAATGYSRRLSRAGRRPRSGSCPPGALRPARPPWRGAVAGGHGRPR
jgi:tetratricopeptide (TPR) repeat protein